MQPGKVFIIWLGAAVLGLTGLGYYNHSGSTPEPTKPAPVAPLSDQLTIRQMGVVTSKLQRAITIKENREIALFLRTAVDVGYDEQRLNSAFDYGVRFSQAPHDVAYGFALAAGLQAAGGHIGELSEREKSEIQEWEMCAKRIKQIDEGMI